jgi:hypothetical protein
MKTCIGRAQGLRSMRRGRLSGLTVRLPPNHYTLMLTEGLDRPIVVPLEEAEESGLRSDQVRVDDIHGGGFVANVEGLYHLHCLVSLFRRVVL